MILELDIGNTRIKWRLAVSGAADVAGQGVASNLDELMAALAGRRPDRIRVASVRRGETLTDLQARAGTDWGLDIEIARVQRACQGISVGYADLARLGVDRWLAMLAAYRYTGSAVAVVDCGTALTVDLVDDGGRHLGGYIVPGLRLCTRALTENTGIRLESEPGWSTEPGNSSEEAVYHGVLSMLVGLLERVLTRLDSAHGAAPQVYFTGGDARLIVPHLSDTVAKAVLEPDLVLNGLAVAMP